MVTENHMNMCTLKGKSKEVWWFILHFKVVLCVYNYVTSLYHARNNHDKVNLYCSISERLPKLHPSPPSCRRRAALRLWHACLSASVWLPGRNKQIDVDVPDNITTFNLVLIFFRILVTFLWKVRLKMAEGSVPLTLHKVSPLLWLVSWGQLYILSQRQSCFEKLKNLL